VTEWCIQSVSLDLLPAALLCSLLPLRLFLFSSYGPPRYLPSFPTRRSSDLRLPPGATTADPALPVRLSPGRGRGGSGYRRVHPPDRKSTRLESSHEWISDAVLCLQKKQCRPAPRAF